MVRPGEPVRREGRYVGHCCERQRNVERTRKNSERKKCNLQGCTGNRGAGCIEIRNGWEGV
eukprot:1047084-Rhodomonas_salina.1